MAETFFAEVWSTLQYVFTQDLKAFKFAGLDEEIPYFWSLVAAFVLICVCIPCCICCTRKKHGRGLDKKKMGLAHAPSTQAPHNPDEDDVELGKTTTSNPVTATSGKEGSSKSTKKKSVAEAKKSGEKPPVAKKKSLRASLGREMSKLIGREVEKWKAEMDEHGRTYYVNQDTGESVWEIPKSSKSSPWIESVDENGRKYYYNTETGESRWTDPEQDNSDGLPPGWQIIQDSSGREYYYNATTGQSQWDKPTGSGSEIMAADKAPTQQL